MKHLAILIALLLSQLLSAQDKEWMNDVKENYKYLIQELDYCDTSLVDFIDSLYPNRTYVSLMECDKRRLRLREVELTTYGKIVYEYFSFQNKLNYILVHYIEFDDKRKEREIYLGEYYIRYGRHYFSNWSFFKPSKTEIKTPEPLSTTQNMVNRFYNFTTTIELSE